METEISRKQIFENSIVIVIDNENYWNYRKDYVEDVPFKAHVESAGETTLSVISLKTKKRYELYYTQILEALDINEIKRLIALGEYGEG